MLRLPIVGLVDERDVLFFSKDHPLACKWVVPAVMAASMLQALLGAALDGLHGPRYTGSLALCPALSWPQARV